MLTPIYRKYACAPFCRASGGPRRRWRVVQLRTVLGACHPTVNTCMLYIIVQHCSLILQAEAQSLALERMRRRRRSE